MRQVLVELEGTVDQLVDQLGKLITTGLVRNVRVLAPCNDDVYRLCPLARALGGEAPPREPT